MQTLSPDMMRTASEAKDDSIPSLEGAHQYFALVQYEGKRILCILSEEGKWRPTTYDEMMRMM